MQKRSKGISAALISALFLGMAPVFGRQAILSGLAPLAVVAIRTTAAALLLLLVMVFFFRRHLYIYPGRRYKWRGLSILLQRPWTN
jgi:uncharacterized membrane protein